MAGMCSSPAPSSIAASRNSSVRIAPGAMRCPRARTLSAFLLPSSEGPSSEEKEERKLGARPPPSADESADAAWTEVATSFAFALPASRCSFRSFRSRRFRSASFFRRLSADASLDVLRTSADDPISSATRFMSSGSTPARTRSAMSVASGTLTSPPPRSTASCVCGWAMRRSPA